MQDKLIENALQTNRSESVEALPIPSPPKPLEPSSLKAWRLEEEDLDTIVEEERQINASLTKPKSSEWFIVCPKTEAWVPCYIFKQPGVGSEAIFIVDLKYVGLMSDCVRKVKIVPWMNVDGAIQFWPLAIPDPLKPIQWHTSACVIAEAGRGEWQRMVADTKNGFYRAVKPVKPKPFPQWPDSAEIEKLLLSAVSERMIAADDHPALKAYLMN